MVVVGRKRKRNWSLGGGVGSVRDQRDEKYVLGAMGSTICAGL